MNSINNIFDKVFVINLERDQEKMDSVAKRLKKVDIIYEKFEAIDGKKIGKSGTYGCKMSHINIIENAKSNNYRRILILEDDVILRKDFLKKFSDVYSLIKKNQDDDWKFLYLGAFYYRDFNRKLLLPNYFIGNKCVGGFAVGIDHSIYDDILKYKDDNKNDMGVIDVIYMNLQNKYKTLVINPHLITALVNKISNTYNKITSQTWFNNWNNINIKDFYYERLENFNWINYVEKYPDLRKVGIYTKKLAFKHYLDFGIYENRSC